MTSKFIVIYLDDTYFCVATQKEYIERFEKGLGVYKKSEPNSVNARHMRMAMEYSSWIWRLFYTEALPYKGYYY